MFENAEETMKARHFLTGLAATAALLVGTQSPALAQSAFTPLGIDQFYDNVKGWTVGLNKGFEGCWITATFKDETTVWMGFSGDDKNSFIAFTNPKWKSIKEGKEYNLTMLAQGIRNWKGQYTGIQLPANLGSDPGIFAGPLKEDFIGDLAATGGITLILGKSKVAQLSMTASAAAILKALECHKEYHAGNFGKDDEPEDEVAENGSDSENDGENDDTSSPKGAADAFASRFASPSSKPAPKVAPKGVEIHSSCGDVDCVIVKGLEKSFDKATSKTNVKATLLYYLKSEPDVRIGGDEEGHVEYAAYCPTGFLFEQRFGGDAIQSTVNLSGTPEKGKEVEQAIWNYACKGQ